MKKEIVVDADGTPVDVDMTIWDIMGEKGFRELLKEAYFYGAKGILAVCDATRKKTLEDLEKEIAERDRWDMNRPISPLGSAPQRW